MEQRQKKQKNEKDEVEHGKKDFAKYMELRKIGKGREAFESLKRAADANHPDALFQLGVYYNDPVFGFGFVKYDKRKANALWATAILATNHPLAFYEREKNFFTSHAFPTANIFGAAMNQELKSSKLLQSLHSSQFFCFYHSPEELESFFKTNKVDDDDFLKSHVYFYAAVKHRTSQSFNVAYSFAKAGAVLGSSRCMLFLGNTLSVSSWTDHPQNPRNLTEAWRWYKKVDALCLSELSSTKMNHFKYFDRHERTRNAIYTIITARRYRQSELPSFWASTLMDIILIITRFLWDTRNQECWSLEDIEKNK